MYEHQTYEAILQRMLNRVPGHIDKRQGSIIFDALAPAAAELAQMYAELDVSHNLSFADTATGEYLSRRAAEFGVNRKAASKAIRQAMFYGNDDQLMDIPHGSRFSIESVNFVATEKISVGTYRLECETVGVIGNQFFGKLLPIQTIDGLVRAELGDVLFPGEDEEDDDVLRRRYYEAVNEPPFGGNVADYNRKIEAIDGVGDVKVFPAWNGGGTVKCTIIAADWMPPSAQLVDKVQQEIDPHTQGKGLGQAPIGHRVTVAGVGSVTIDVTTTVTLADGMTVGQVQEAIEQAMDDYVLGLRQSWADEAQLVVRVAQVEAVVLGVSGVIDVSGTLLNGSGANIVLDQEEVPVLGTVVVHV